MGGTTYVQPPPQQQGPNPAAMAGMEMLKNQSALVTQAQNEIAKANDNIAGANAALNMSLLEQEAEQIKRRDADAVVRAQILMNSQRNNMSSFSNMKNFTSLKPLLNITEGSISRMKNAPPANIVPTDYIAAVNQQQNQTNI